MSTLGTAFTNRPHQVLEQIRESCPVVPLTTPAGGTVWVVTRGEDVRAGFLDPRLSLRAERPSAGPAPRRAMDVTLMKYDPPRLTRIRGLATPLFTSQRMATHRPVIESVARERLAALSEAAVVDLMEGFARPFAFQVLCELFGIPGAVRADLYGWMSAVFDRPAHSPAAIERCFDRIDELVTIEIGHRIDEPGEDIWSAIATAWAAQREITRQELVSLCGMLLLAGFDTTAQAIGICVLALLRDGGLRELIRTEESAVSRAVAEILRLDSPSPFATKRRAVRDIAIDGTVIPAGSGVLLAMASANRDPRCYPDPGRLDVDRPNLERHLAFGLGPHRCPGAALAKLELTVALTELVRHRPHARLAVAEQALRWTGNYYHRQLAELPMIGRAL